MDTTQFSQRFPLGSHLCREPMPAMSEMKRDMELLRRQGFNLIKLQEHWMTDEPVEGQFQFERYEELILCGGIYYADGEPAGFIIGEDISESMFTLHLAKGKRKFKGLYQYMFNNFANVMPVKYCLLNLEQDMGIESLRQAKASYYPDKLLKKYRVSPGL